MTLKRKLAGLSVAVLTGLFAVVAVHFEWVSVADLSAAMAFAIVATITGAFYWSWKPEIDHWFAVRKYTAASQAESARVEVRPPTEQGEPARLPQAYSVSLAQEPDGIRMEGIRVRLGPNDKTEEEAKFYVVSVGVPVGCERAEDVQFFFKSHNSEDIFQMLFIPSTGRPWITANWIATKEEFMVHKDRFAEALIQAKECRIDNLRLEAGRGLVSFIFFFTIRGFNSVYFPSLAHRAFNIPVKFQTALIIGAKGRPETLLKMFEVDARSWNEVSVTELRNPPSP